MSLILLQITSLVYVVLLNIFYFMKEHISNLENRIFKCLLVSNVFGLLIELGCFYTVMHMDKIPIINVVVTKALLIYYLLFLMIYTYYVFVVAFNEKNSDLENSKFFYTVKCVCIGLFFVLSAIEIFLPMEYYNDGTYVYSYGISVRFLQIVLIIVMNIWLIIIVWKIKNISMKQYLPIFIFLILAGIGGAIQMKYPYILLTTPIETLVIFLMYFTIENPDVKLIKELTTTNDLLEREKDATVNSMNNLSSSIDASLTKLLQFGNKYYNSDDEFIKDKEEIQKYSVNLVNEIKSSIELSKIESGKYPLKKYKYDTKELFGEIRELFDIKATNDKVKFTYDFDNNIHPVLSGDDEKIKETLISLYSTIMANFEVKDILLKLDVYELGVVSRMKFTMIIDNTKGLDKIEDYDKVLSGLEYNVLKKLVELQKIKFTINNVDGKLEFCLTINQRIEKNYQEVEISKRNRRVEYFDLSSKNILLVDDNKDKINNLILLLEPYHINITVAYDYIEFTNLLYGDNHYDMILLDDMMPDSSEFYWLDANLIGNPDISNKIKRMAGYSPNVVVMLTSGNDLESKYKTYNLDYIMKPMDSNKLHNILKKYLK